MKRLLALALCLSILPPPAGAEERRLWKETAPVAVPVTGDSWTPGAPSGALSDINPSAPEKAAFWDHVVGSSFDQLCKNVHLKLGQDLGVGMAAGTYYTGRYLGGVLGASLAGAVLGTTVTAAGVTLGFGLLVLVGLGVVVVSFGLPDRPARRSVAAVEAAA